MWTRFLDLLSRGLPQLDIWEVSAKFKCLFAINEARFFKAFNSILGKVGRNALEEVLFASIRSKCLPILLYGIDACPINELNSMLSSLIGTQWSQQRRAERRVVEYSRSHFELLTVSAGPATGADRGIGYISKSLRVVNVQFVGPAAICGAGSGRRLRNWGHLEATSSC